MECQACSFAPIVAALAELMRTFTVTIKGESSSTRTKELNAIDTKIAREVSKKKPKAAVIEPLRKVSKSFRHLASLAEDQYKALTKYENILAQSKDAHDLTNLRTVIDTYKAIYNRVFQNKSTLENCIHAFVSESRLVPELINLAPRHREIVSLIETMLPDLQQICCGCSATSNDDNLSNHGQIFVSIDSMATIGLAAAEPSQSFESAEDAINSGEANSCLNNPDDPNSDSDAAYRSFYDSTSASAVAQSAHDYLLAHTAPDATFCSSGEHSVSTLPSHIEDTLREHLAVFAALTPFEQLLCFSQWSGQTFSDFATMKWVPSELLRPQSKQFITSRWNKLVEKFPLADALKRTTPIKSVSSALSKHYAEQAFECGEFEFTASNPTSSSELFD